MYVCVCRAITEDQLIELSQNGRLSTKDVLKKLGVGNDCGVCLTDAIQGLEAARQAKDSSVKSTHTIKKPTT